MDQEYNNIDVEDNYNYHIIPFVFNKKYDNKLLQSIESYTVQNEQGYKTENVKFWDNAENIKGRISTSPHIYEHVRNLFSSHKSNYSTGTKFTLEAGVRSTIGLPPNERDEIAVYRRDIKWKNKTYEVKEKQMDFRFKISRIDLYLFETQIGFLCFETEFDSKTTLEQIIEYNYILRHFNKASKKLALVKKHIKILDSDNMNNMNNDKDLYIEYVEEFDLNKIIEIMLKGLEDITYFEGNGSSPWKTHIFSSVKLKFKPKDDSMNFIIKKTLFEMRRIFKNTYQPTEKELDLDNNSSIIQPFENIYWGVSLEGCINLSYLNGNKKNAEFMKSFQGNVKKEYVFMYIVALHQKYALLNYAIETSKANINVLEKSEVELESPIMHLLELKARIAAFFIRSYHLNISNISHYNDIYSLMLKVMRIEEYIKEINIGVDGISKIHEQHKNSLVIKRDQRENAFNRHIIILSTIFVLFETVNTLWDMANKLYHGDLLPIDSISFVLFLFFSVIIIYYTLSLLIKHIKNTYNLNI